MSPVRFRGIQKQNAVITEKLLQQNLNGIQLGLDGLDLVVQDVDLALHSPLMGHEVVQDGLVSGV